MNIFIDHQYKEIYNKEFTNLIENSIVEPIKSMNNNVIIGKDLNDTKNILSKSIFDIVIITGYDSIPLTYININQNKTTIISIIYEMNAEIISQNIENSFIEDVIAHKARLIFLSSNIITFYKSVSNDIKEIYLPYKQQGLNIESKLVELDYIIKDKEKTNLRKQIPGKYIVITTSINGFTFYQNEFLKLIEDLKNSIENENIPDNFSIIVPCKDIPAKIYSLVTKYQLNNILKFVKDLTIEEENSLYKHSIATFILSPLESNIELFSSIIENDSIVVLNENDFFIREYINESEFLTFNPEENIIDIVKNIMRSLSKDKNEIKQYQRNFIALKKNSQSTSKLEKVLNKIKIAKSNK